MATQHEIQRFITVFKLSCAEAGFKFVVQERATITLLIALDQNGKGRGRFSVSLGHVFETATTKDALVAIFGKLEQWPDSLAKWASHFRWYQRSKKAGSFQQQPSKASVESSDVQSAPSVEKGRAKKLVERERRKEIRKGMQDQNPQSGYAQWFSKNSVVRQSSNRAGENNMQDKQALQEIVLRLEADGGLTAANLVPYADALTEFMNERAQQSGRYTPEYALTPNNVRSAFDLPPIYVPAAG